MLASLKCAHRWRTQLCCAQFWRTSVRCVGLWHSYVKGPQAQRLPRWVSLGCTSLWRACCGCLALFFNPRLWLRLLCFAAKLRGCTSCSGQWISSSTTSTIYPGASKGEFARSQGQGSVSGICTGPVSGSMVPSCSPCWQYVVMSQYQRLCRSISAPVTVPTSLPQDQNAVTVSVSLSQYRCPGYNTTCAVPSFLTGGSLCPASWSLQRHCSALVGSIFPPPMSRQ